MEENKEQESTLLARWMKGTISKEEKIKLENDPAFETYKKVAEASGRLYIEKPNLDDQFQKLLEKRQEQTIKAKKGNYKNWFYAAAAAIVILFGINFLINSQQESTVTTTVAETKNLVLPDGSTVQLNATSSVTYDAKDFLKTRTLTLDGEAYFKVQKGSAFTVKTKNGAVLVLGTAFNVYSREKDFKIFCDEGRVQVQSNSKTIILNAGEGAFAKAEVPLSTTPPTIKSPQWRSGRTYFQKETLKEVYRALERQFPVTIRTERIDVDRLYNGYFDHSNLENALDEISKPMRITYEIKGSEVILSPAQ